MIDESFIEQEKALSAFAIGSNLFSIHRINNKTLFLIFLFRFQLFIYESHIPQ